MTMFQQKRAPRLASLISAHAQPSRAATPHMWVWRAFIVVGWGLIVTSLCLFAWEFVHWLQDGIWHSISIAKMTRMPNLDREVDHGWSCMEIVRVAFRWFGRMPATTMLFIGGLVCSWRANDLHAAAEADVVRRT